MFNYSTLFIVLKLVKLSALLSVCYQVGILFISATLQMTITKNISIRLFAIVVWKANGNGLHANVSKWSGKQGIYLEWSKIEWLDQRGNVHN